MSDMKLRLKILRGAYTVEKAEFKVFEVEVQKGMTFLRILQKIKEETDPSLSFRHFCRAGICGTCAILIDGFPRLACKEQVLSYALIKEEVTLEPLKGFPLLKDLVVDHEVFTEKMKKYKTWLLEGEEYSKITPTLHRKIERAADCILCYACQSYCPQVLEEDYAGPVIFAKLYRLIKDPRNAIRDERFIYALDKGHLYHCLSCNKCNNCCPTETKPADLIREIMVYTGKNEEVRS